MTVPQYPTLDNTTYAEKVAHLKALTALCTPQELGAVGELIALDWLTETGYLAEHARGCDLIVGDPHTNKVRKVEVKASRMSENGSYEFSLFKRDHTDHKRSEFLVLLCFCPDGAILPFVIPVSAVMLTNKITIPTDPRTYTGRFARYLNLSGTLSLNE